MSTVYVVLEGVTLVRLTAKSIKVVLATGETCYVPFSQMAAGELDKCEKLLATNDMTDVNLDVSKWWADTAGVEYSEL